MRAIDSARLRRNSIHMTPMSTSKRRLPLLRNFHSVIVLNLEKPLLDRASCRATSLHFSPKCRLLFRTRL